MLENNETLATAPISSSRRKLPLRDFILVPLLSVSTILVMFGAAEVGARAVWPALENRTCFFRDQYDILRAKHNCTVRSKIPEGPWVTYHYNDCGYRSNSSCGPTPPGTLRIALLGSSVSEGLNVPYEQTFAERTARALTAATGRSVEVQNLGFENLSPLHCYRKLDEVLALHPDFVVYAVSPFDLSQDMDREQLAHRNDPPAVSSRPLTHYAVARVKLLQEAVTDSRAIVVAQHLLFSNSETYLRLYMAYGDRADYLRTPLNSRWQARFADFDVILTDMSARFRRAGIPLLVIAVPSLPQAALLSVDRPPPATDPFTFSRPLEEMTAKLGIDYVDALEDFKRTPHCDRLFYVVDSHLTSDGNAVVAQALVARCLHGGIRSLQPN